MKRAFTLLVSAGCFSVIMIYMHGKFMETIPVAAGTQPIITMEIFAVVALIVAYTFGHVIGAAQKDSSHEGLKFGDIVKVLFTVAASGFIYLGLLDLFKTHANR